MTRFHTFRAKQWVERPTEEVFDFFSDAHNLQVLTPPWLSFQIMTPSPIVLQAGTIIQYKLRLHGIPLRWTTEIRHWKPPFQFVDTQIAGPYKLWHHTHLFAPHNGGTLMRDIVRYRMPFGILGRIADTLQAKNDVRKIFAYRYEQIERRFGKIEVKEIKQN